MKQFQIQYYFVMNSALLINNGDKSDVLTFFRSEVRGGNLQRSGYGEGWGWWHFSHRSPRKPLVMVDRPHHRGSQPSDPEFQPPPPLAKSLVLMLKLAIVDRTLNNSSVEAKSQRHSQKQAYGWGEAGVITLPSLFFQRFPREIPRENPSL